MKKNKLQVNKKDTSEQEINVISKASRRAWTTFGIIAFILMTIFLVACIIDIYQFFYSLHEIAGYVSLGVIILVLLIFVVRPIVVALSSPCFTLDVVEEGNLKRLNKKNYLILMMLNVKSVLS